MFNSAVMAFISFGKQVWIFLGLPSAYETVLFHLQPLNHFKYLLSLSSFQQGKQKRLANRQWGSERANPVEQSSTVICLFFWTNTGEWCDYPDKLYLFVNLRTSDFTNCLQKMFLSEQEDCFLLRSLLNLANATSLFSQLWTNLIN